MIAVAPHPLGLMPRPRVGQVVHDVLVEMTAGPPWRSVVTSHPACVRHWMLGDVASSTALDDISGGAGNGTYTGSPTTGRGIVPDFAMSTTFDGVDDGVSIPSGLTGSGAFTFVCWVRITPGATNGRTLVRSAIDPTAPALTVTVANVLQFGTGAGGNYITHPVALPVNTPCLVAGVFNPSGSSLLAYSVAGAPFTREYKTLTTFATAHGTGTIAAPAGQGGHDFFAGIIQGVAFYQAALTDPELDALRTAGTWAALTSDVETSDALSIDGGIHEDSPLTRQASSGICTFTVDNSERNSAGLVGYYSPGHVNARPGWGRGTMIRVSFDTANGIVPQFTGKIRTIKPDAGIYRERRVQVMATDWLDEAARRPVHGIPTLTNVRADQVIATLVNTMRNRPHGLLLARGSDVYPFVLDATTAATDSIAVELKRIVDSERGYLYMRGDGTLVFENRYDRARIDTAQFDLADVLNAELTRASEDIINRVEVTIHPRRLDAAATTILYRADSPQTYESTGAPITVWLPFRDPVQQAVRVGGLDIQPFTPTTDYVINTESNGSGTDLTTDPRITIVMVADATGVHLTITNTTGADIHFTKLQVRGRGLYHYDPITIVEEDQASIDEEGVQLAQFDMPYQTRIGIAEATAMHMLNTFSAAPTRVDAVPFWMFQDPTLEAFAADVGVSTRVRFIETVGGIDNDYFVNAKKIDLRAGGDVDVTVWLTPAQTVGIALFDSARFDDPGSRFAF